MTSERKRAANRANAQRSTGPRTAKGKRSSAQNARRHGLNAPLEHADIERWYRIIVADPSATLPVIPASGLQRAALHLAEAEAHLARCSKSERDHLWELVGGALRRGRLGRLEISETEFKEGLNDMAFIDLLIETFSAGDPDHCCGRLATSDQKSLLRALRIIKAGSPNRPSKQLLSAGTYRNYRRRAEGHRRRALARWITACSHQSVKRSQICA